MRHYRITTVLDVGANEGQYARELRLAGYSGRILSFEPMSEAFARLAEATRKDPNWDAVHIGLGRMDGEADINVSANSISSSLLPMLPAHENAAVNASVVAVECVPIRRLDGIIGDLIAMAERLYLKIDVQGYELEVLEGATGVLDQIVGLQIELSLVPLYEGGPQFDDVVRWAHLHGFELMGIEPGFADPASGRLLQCDGIFYRV